MSEISSNDFALDNQLCFAIYNANLWFGRFYQQALKPYGLTYTQYLILLALWDSMHADDQPNGQLSLRDLGTKLSLNSNTLTPLLRRMEDAGWVLRLRPDTDRRQLLVQLTEKGRRAQEDIEGRISVCVMHGFKEDKTPGASDTADIVDADGSSPATSPAPDLAAFRRILDDSHLLVDHLKKIVN
ncbi:MAG: MarR family transcriptional regulator [Bifidobacteriaceae bacterium]|jgi:DNA-binding MarR family transcriptional regulator|nr:MarR family transcriptional regulator [Bifidobacteriaceae bacterium]